MSRAAKKRNWIRTVLYKCGYTTTASLANVTLSSVSNGYLYFYDGGVLYWADINGTLAS